MCANCNNFSLVGEMQRESYYVDLSYTKDFKNRRIKILEPSLILQISYLFVYRATLENFVHCLILLPVAQSILNCKHYRSTLVLLNPH